uniref:Uncharacterized protein n=1 Tax=Arundo donax TaxID=35708 RepID=A0A0A8XWS5_ARUDO
MDADSEEDTLLSISQEAMIGGQTPRTIRLWGMVEDKEVLILVDSGSPHSLISSHLAALLKHKKTVIPETYVKVANGGLMSCNSMLSQCEWWVQGHSFATDLRILPLGCYDMILGMNWL